MNSIQEKAYAVAKLKSKLRVNWAETGRIISTIHWQAGQELRLGLLAKLVSKVRKRRFKKKEGFGGEAKLIMRQQGQGSFELKPLGVYLWLDSSRNHKRCLQGIMAAMVVDVRS